VKRGAQSGAIVGVVAFHSRVRRGIAEQGGLTLALASAIMEQLERVHAWCAQHGRRIDSLPPMTRRAVEDLTRIIMEAGSGKGEIREEASPVERGWSVPGLQRKVTGWLDRLAAARNPAARTLYREDALEWMASLRSLMEYKGCRQDDLPVNEQRLLARFSAWCETPWHEVIPAAAEVFEGTLMEGMPPAFFGMKTAQRPGLRYLPVDGRLWQVTRRGRLPEFSISEMFLLDGSLEVPRRLARLLSGQAGRLAARERRFLRDWIRSGTVVDYILRIGRDVCPGEGGARGMVRDLVGYWERINERDFAGRLGRPDLGWTRRVAHCRTGYYDAMTDRIVISAALDDAAVPEYVLDFVLYHEMLHQASRLDILTGRGRVHDRDFRIEEQRHPRYHEAEAFLRGLAHKR